jgi:NADPH:quinone reductase-like Zn-dependent oxidoreductase
MTEPTITSQALQLTSYDGAPDSLRLVERSLGPLRPGQVLVRMAAAPINPSDLMFVRGLYGIKKDLPTVPGFEGSGTVVAGAGALGRLLLGRRVACAATPTGDGTWAEYMVTAASLCMPLAAGISLEQGATLIVNPVTAWALVDQARRERHAAVVQTAAASQVGHMVIRLARRYGLPLINVVRRAEQVAALQQLGARYVLNSSDADFADRLAELCARLKATLAFDAVAGDLTGQLLGAMPAGGHVIVYGALSEAGCSIHPGDLIFGRKRVSGFWLSDWMGGQSPLGMIRLAATIQRLLSSDLASTVQARLPLSAGAAGLERYRLAMSGGKVLFTPEQR